jgi:hypothetical protein
MILEIIRSVLRFYFTLVIDELSSKILFIYVEFNNIHFELNWVNIWIEIHLKDICFVFIFDKAGIILEFELKCEKRWYPGPIPCESNLFPSLILLRDKATRITYMYNLLHGKIMHITYIVCITGYATKLYA